MKKIFLSIFLFYCLPATINAQFSLAPEAGLNLPNMTIKLIDPANGGGKVSTGVRTAVAAGAVAEYGFSEKLYLQSGLFYKETGCKVPTNAYIHINTIQVPLSIDYKQGSDGASRFFAGIGPYLGYNFSGKSNIEDSVKKLTFGSSSKDDIKTIDWGIGLNLGVQLSNDFYLRTSYELGIANLQPQGTTYNSIRTSAIGVDIGYYIIHKHKKSKPVKKK